MFSPAIDNDYISKTNLTDDTMAVLYLSKQGYGTPQQIQEWDTPEFLDALEYEAIENAISRHLQWKAEQESKNKRGKR